MKPLRLRVALELVLLFLLAVGWMCSCGSAVTTPAPPPTIVHSVSIDWDVSAGPDTYIGYNVYRGQSVTGPWTKLTPAPINQLDYDDLAVTAGQTYDYYVTAVDTTDRESAMSNIVTATVPDP